MFLTSPACASQGHLRVVKPQAHKVGEPRAGTGCASADCFITACCQSSHRLQDFCDAYTCSSFFISAKSGDNVAQMFFRVAADLAGVTVSKPDIAASGKVVPAAIVNHARDDVTIDAPAIGERKEPSNKKCCIQ